MKQYLFYTSDDAYSYDLRLNKQLFYRDGHPNEVAEGQAYLEHFTKRFKEEEFAALLIMVLELDPVNGVTNIVKNEFMTSPLKKKIVINARVLDKGTKPAAKKMLGQMISDAQFNSLFDEVQAQPTVSTQGNTVSWNTLAGIAPSTNV